MESILVIIGIACFGYIVAETDLANEIKTKAFGYIPKNKITNFLNYVFNCCLCISFWTCLAYTLDPLSAFTCGVISEIVSKYIGYEI